MKKFLISLAIIMTGLFGVFSATSTPVYAEGEGGGCEPGSTVFFALKPWYHNLTNSDCSIKNPSELKPDKEDTEGKNDKDSTGMATFIWTIVLNILYDISVLVGYFTILMIAWGGYLYMFSRGDVGKAEKGKKTLISAIIGLVIAMLASVIMNTISAIIIQ